MLGAKKMLKEKRLIMLPTTVANDEELLENIHETIKQSDGMEQYARWVPYKVLKRKPIHKTLMRGVIEDTGMDLVFLWGVHALERQAEELMLQELGRGGEGK